MTPLMRATAERWEELGREAEAARQWGAALQHLTLAGTCWGTVGWEESDAEAHRRSARCWLAAAAACDRLSNAADEKAEALEGANHGSNPKHQA